MQFNLLALTVTLLLATLLNNLHTAAGRPDVRQSPFALELQPPLPDTDTAEAFKPGGEKAIDSYGNPIDSLRPIDTPDGRKVVSAQGLQFEIPNYASGITEIRKPADDLLPPHIAPLDTKIAPPSSESNENPFDSSTVPAWLRDFDYPDVGPGVPFNPDNFREPASGNDNQGVAASKPQDFRPSTEPPSLKAPLPTTSTAPAKTASSSSAFPSKVTLPLPAISSHSEETNTVEPPLVLIPPESVTANAPSTAAPHSPSSTNSITNFAAQFDPPALATPTQPPLSAVEEQFPPFNSEGGANAQPKVEYTKSEEGKVISTPLSTPRKDLPSAAPAVNTGKYTGGFGAPAGLLRPQSAASAKPDIYVAGNEHEFSNNVNKISKSRPASVNPGRYTGGFGAPSGVLSPQSEQPRPFQAQQTQTVHHLATAASSHHASRFGGPPGILVPFDNVQRAEGQ